MRGIIRKDWPWFALFTVPIFGLLCVYQVVRGMPRDLSDLFLMGFYFLLVAWGGVSMSETMEGGRAGYEFLRTLPVTDREIVAAKFTLAAVTVALCLAAEQGVVWTSDLPRTKAPLASLYMVSSAVGGLLVAGLAYIGVYTWRFSRVRVIAWVCFPVLIVLFILFIELVLQKGRLNPAGLFSLSQWFVYALSAAVAAAGSAVYYGLMKVAIRTRAQKEA